MQVPVYFVDGVALMDGPSVILERKQAGPRDQQTGVAPSLPRQRQPHPSATMQQPAAAAAAHPSHPQHTTPNARWGWPAPTHPPCLYRPSYRPSYRRAADKDPVERWYTVDQLLADGGADAFEKVAARLIIGGKVGFRV